MKDLIKVIEQEAYEYSDPITGTALPLNQLACDNGTQTHSQHLIMGVFRHRAMQQVSCWLAAVTTQFQLAAARSSSFDYKKHCAGEGDPF